MDPFRNYDSWLEEPFQRMIEESDRYYDFCESEELDPDTQEAEEAYNDYCDDSDYWEKDYEDYE